MEILGNNLKKFFDTVDSECKDADITYAGKSYEVWEVSDILYRIMCTMSEKEFIKIAGKDAWWRYSKGTIFNTPHEKNIVNDKELISWNKGFFYLEETRLPKKYDCLLDYLCDCFYILTPMNICSCCVDLAKCNNITMAELFEKYEG